MTMAKLTVFFKYKAIDSYLFEKGVVHIGRDESNDVAIDSLAVAPVHAVIMARDDTTVIKQLNDGFALIVNGKPVKEYDLQHNDTITIGKHDIVYSLTETYQQETHSTHENVDYSKPSVPANFDLDEEANLPNANLQVMSGVNIGKVLPIKKSMTRLGNAGSGVVVIAKRKDAYYVSALENKGILKINNSPLGDNYIKLNNNDVIVINQTELQFFLD